MSNEKSMLSNGRTEGEEARLSCGGGDEGRGWNSVNLCQRTVVPAGSVFSRANPDAHASILVQGKNSRGSKSMPTLEAGSGF